VITLLNIPRLVTIARSSDELPLLLRPSRRAVGVYLTRLWLFLLSSFGAGALFFVVALLVRAGSRTPGLATAVSWGIAGVVCLTLGMLFRLLLLFLWKVYVADVAKALREQIYDAHDDDDHHSA